MYLPNICCRARRDPDIRQVLRIPQVLRPYTDLSQACRLRYSTPGQESVLCSGI